MAERAASAVLGNGFDGHLAGFWGCPGGIPRGLEGPQGAAMRPTRTPSGPLPASRRCMPPPGSVAGVGSVGGTSDHHAAFQHPFIPLGIHQVGQQLVGGPLGLGFEAGAQRPRHAVQAHLVEFVEGGLVIGHLGPPQW